MTENTVGI